MLPELAEVDVGDVHRSDTVAVVVEVESHARHSMPTGRRCIVRTPGDAAEELDDAGVERVIAITGNHVSRARHVDVLGVRNEGEELAGAFLREQVAPSAANQQGGPLQRPCIRLELFSHEKGAWLVDVRVAHEARMPMPVPPAVGATAHVLLQAEQVGRATDDAGCRRRSRPRPLRARQTLLRRA